MSYELFEQGPAAYVPVILVSLVVTLVAYGAFPLIFARTRKKAITKRKYNVLCYCFNALVMILFIAINGEPSSGAPYLLWTWVFSASGLKTLKSRGVLEGFQVFDYTKTSTSQTSQVRNGGGVYVGGDGYESTGDAGKTTANISGNVTIKDNKKGEADSNLFLASGKTINITDELTNTDKIGVTTETAPVDGSPVAVTGDNSVDYSGKFKSDNTKYEVYNDSNTVKLKLVPYGTSANPATTAAELAAALGGSEYAEASGGTVKLLKNVSLTDTLYVAPGSDNTLYLDLNGHAVTGASGKTAVENKGTGELRVEAQNEANDGEIKGISAPALVNSSTGTLQINMGTMTSTSGAAIRNTAAGTVSLGGGGVFGSGNTAVENISTGKIQVDPLASIRGIEKGSGTLKDNDDKEVSLYTFNLDGVAAETAVKSIKIIENEDSSNAGGGFFKTDVDGKIYIWSSKTLATAYAKIAGDIEYASNGPITGNAATLKRVHEITWNYYDAANKCFVFTTSHLSQYVLVSDAGANPFTDVKAGDYYYDAVLWAAKNEITSGTDATHFAPNGFCTRAQAVAFLWRASGSPEPTSTTCPFTDVSKDAYYYKAVLWAVEKGITKGTSATAFSPDDTCTRAQIVSFQYRAALSPATGTVNQFTDVANNAYYASAVKWAAEKSVTEGTTTTTFSPNAGCTRGQIAVFLFRQLGK